VAATMTWEERGLLRADGTPAAKPWSQGERNAEWVRLYREEGLDFSAIARRTGAGYSMVRDTVTSFHTRGGYMNWRRCRAC
jgi:hypothetical protein